MGNDREDLTVKIACKIGSLPSTYLCLPLGTSFKSVAAWNVIGERSQRRLAMWRRLYISKGGRITLIQSTLVSLPIYFRSFFPIRMVRLWMEQVRRNFLWRGGALKGILTWWNGRCSTMIKKRGVLGV